ncbi:hypothetical protein ACFVY4_03765 [Streptomyces sp. NPDC058299]
MPPPLTRRCDRCVGYTRRQDDADAWAEQQARDLFLSKGTARLL